MSGAGFRRIAARERVASEKPQKDIAKLADLLGHFNIETTRIYLLSSGQEHQKVLDSLHLVC